jgi:hypothetical protein
VTDDHELIVALNCGNIGHCELNESLTLKAQDGTSDSMAALAWPEIATG